MSNDLSANMRRSKMDARDDERRLAVKAVRQSLEMRTISHYQQLTDELDTLAYHQGYSREQMIKMAKQMQLNDFAVFYERHSITIRVPGHV